MINAGTAGGFRAKGAEIGDVFVSSTIRNHDRRIAIPSYDAYGIGEYHSVPTVNLRAVSPLVIGGIGLHYGSRR